MKATIESSFPVRGENVTSYYSFPVYSDKIEETMIRQLEFLKQYDKFLLVLKISKDD
jgi:hypothetical protein